MLRRSYFLDGGKLAQLAQFARSAS